MYTQTIRSSGKGGLPRTSRRDFTQRLRDYAAALSREMVRLDEESGWASETFIPLEVDTLVGGPGRWQWRPRDLLRALRSNRRGRITLVLGEPGAGKSVALRRLCRDLLADTRATQTLPLYVNLREWAPEQPWTRDAPPTAADLHAFILENLKGRADVVGAEFLDDCFQPMLERGMLFLVLDSFDEIPAVLDAGGDAWLVDALSSAIDGFLLGAHGSRGVVASRPFRAPGKTLKADTVLEIRPLTERRIARLIDRALYGVDGGRTARRLFRERRELVPAARNPFTVSLLVDYVREHDGALPENQSELYASHIGRRLRAFGERLRESGLTSGEVLDAARDVAAFMLTAEQLGPDAPVDRLAAVFPGRRIETVLEVLAEARLGRLLGPGPNPGFSFVHRRFADWFVVQWMRQDPSRAPEEAIPTDSRFRDPLALYCEVAETADGVRLAFRAGLQAEQGWLEEPASDTHAYRAGVQGLRFLADAFLGRPDCIAPHRHLLTPLLLGVLQSPASGLVARKLAVEASLLLDEAGTRDCLAAAIELEHPWIDETVLRSSPLLRAADPRVDTALCVALGRILGIDFALRARDLLFAFSLTDAFPRARRFCILRTIHLFTLVAGVVIVLATLRASTSFLLGVLAFVAVMPWYMLMLSPIRLPALKIPPLKRPSRVEVAQYAGTAVLIGVLYPVMISLGKAVTDTQAVILWATAAVLAAGFGVALLIDRRTLRRLASPIPDGDERPRISRAQVAQTWMALTTPYGRAAYARWLKRHRFQAHGDWPERQMPDHTLVAELEEEWLGLQR